MWFFLAPHKWNPFLPPSLIPYENISNFQPAVDQKIYQAGCRKLANCENSRVEIEAWPKFRNNCWLSHAQNPLGPKSNHAGPDLIFFLFCWFFGAETLQSRKRLAKCPGFSGKAFKQIFIKLYKIMKHFHSNERKLESKTGIKNAR